MSKECNFLYRTEDLGNFCIHPNNTGKLIVVCNRALPRCSTVDCPVPIDLVLVKLIDPMDSKIEYATYLIAEKQLDKFDECITTVKEFDNADLDKDIEDLDKALEKNGIKVYLYREVKREF